MTKQNQEAGVKREKHTPDRRLRYLLAYTFLYLLLAGLLVFFCKTQNRSLVYHADAWRQHLRALAYYGKWLRGNLWNLVHDHSLSVQAWSFGLGYGSDVLTTLHYYCIGESLTVLTVLVPEKYTKYYFELLILLRPYLAGISFSAYAEYMLCKVTMKQGMPYAECMLCKGPTKQGMFQQKRHDGGRVHDAGNPYPAILAGALCYAFSGTVLYLGMLHPFFVTPMIYQPLLFLGIEKVLREKKPGVFMVSVWLAGLSNFYFFYMLAVMTSVYALVRVISSVRRECDNSARSGQQNPNPPKYCTLICKAVRRLLGLLGYAIAGTMAAGAVLIPILVQFQSDPRNATAYSVPLFYNKDYYAELFQNAVSFLNHPQYDTELCLSAVCIAAVIALFFLRGHRQLKAAATGAAVMLCLPVAGYVMNGGSYVINRWTFAVEFLFAYVLVVVWSDVQSNFDGKKYSEKRFRNRIGRAAVFALVLVTIAMNIVTGYADIPTGKNGEEGRQSFAAEFTDEQTAEEYMNAACRNESSAVTRYAEETENPVFYRYTGRDLTYNAGLQTQSSSTQFFWSLANGAVSDFFQALGINEEQNFSYTDLDDRTALEALAGVKYYTITYDNDGEKQFVPYGFADCGTVPAADLTEPQAESETASGQDAAGNSQGDLSTIPAVDATGNLQEKSGAVYGDDSWEAVVPSYHIYQNTFALPIGYTYTGSVSRSDFDAMDLTERQETMLQGVVLNSEDEEKLLSEGHLETVQPEFTEEKRSYTIETGEGVSCSFDNMTFENDQMKGESDGGGSTSDDGMDAAGAVRFVVSRPGAKATLHFNAADDAETYLVWRNLEVETLDTAGDFSENPDDLTAESQEAADSERLEETYPITVTAMWDGTALTSKNLNYKTETNQYYSGWKDFAMNMGYRAAGADTLEITFQNEGVYSVSGLSVVTQPVEEMMRHAVELSACTMTNADLHRNPISCASDEITGTVNAEQNRYLVFSIPYSKGWTAYDNGVKVPLQKANLMYLGMPVGAGSHEIRLVYHTPGGRAGILVSAAGVILMVFLLRTAVQKKRGNTV